MLKFFRRKDRGSVLVAVLIFTAVLLVLGAALLAHSVSEKLIAAYHLLDTKRYYVAEAGLEAGMAVLEADFNHREAFGGSLGGGTYAVRYVFPDQEGSLDLHQRKIVSRGVLEGEAISLELISAVDPVYGKALLANDSLTLSDCTIDGHLHVNGALQIEGMNEVTGGGGFTYLKKADISFDTGAELWVNGVRYTGIIRIPGAWKTGQVPVPVIDWQRFERESENLSPVISGIWPPLPACYQTGGEGIQVNGNLAIAPGTNRIDYAGTLVVRGDCTIAGPLDFDGRLIVYGALLIDAGEETPVNMNGLIACTGPVYVYGTLNRGLSNQKLAIVAEEEIVFSVVDAGQEVFLGGTVLLFSETSAVRIGDSGNPPFDLYGSIISGQAELYRCNLHFVPEVFMGKPDLPGSKVVVEEWRKP